MSKLGSVDCKLPPSTTYISNYILTSLVGVELVAGEEGALVLEVVPGAAVLLQRQAVAASRYLSEKGVIQYTWRRSRK